MKQKSQRRNRPGVQLQGQPAISGRATREGRSVKTSIYFGLCTALAAGVTLAVSEKQLIGAPDTISTNDTPAQTAALAAMMQQINQADDGQSPTNSAAAPEATPAVAVTNEAATVVASTNETPVAVISTNEVQTTEVSTNETSAVSEAATNEAPVAEVASNEVPAAVAVMN